MDENFDEWNQKKKLIDHEHKRVFFYEKEIWFTHLGKNIGHEQNGKGHNFLRPVLVVKKFTQKLFWGVPLTKQPKKPGSFFLPFKFKNSDNWLCLHQMKLIDNKRLSYRSGKINNQLFLQVRRQLKTFFDK